MFRFLHTADIHLDSPLRGLERYEGAPAAEIRGATRRALENLVELAIEQSVAFVLVAGDLYDGDWKEFRTGLFFVSQMVKLREAGIPVYLIAGNHDAANKMTRKLPLPENVHLLAHNKPETVYVEPCETAIHGQSFARAAVVENLAAGYPPPEPGMFNVGLLHTAATGREGHEPYAPCTLDDLRARRYDYWALGHVHKRETLAADPPIVFPGNLQGRHVRESGPKGCMLVTVDDRHRARAEPVSLDVFRWEVCQLDPAAFETGYDLLDSVRQGLAELAAKADDRPLAVRVQVSGPSPAHRTLTAEPQRWTNEIRAVAQDLGGREVWIEKVELRTTPPAENSLGNVMDGPVGELIQWIAELKSDPARLTSLGDELAEFRDRLPMELKEGATSLGLERPERIAQLLDQVEQTLVHQLVSREGGA